MVSNRSFTLDRALSEKPAHKVEQHSPYQVTNRVPYSAPRRQCQARQRCSKRPISILEYAHVHCDHSTRVYTGGRDTPNAIHSRAASLSESPTVPRVESATHQVVVCTRIARIHRGSERVSYATPRSAASI